VVDTGRDYSLPGLSEPVKADRRALDMLIENLTGLSVSEAQQVARQAIFAHGAIRITRIPMRK